MSDHKTMTLTLIVWRQKNANDPGKFETYTAKDITEHHSFLEMLDCVNEGGRVARAERGGIASGRHAY